MSSGSLAQEYVARLHTQFREHGVIVGDPSLDLRGFVLGAIEMPGVKLMHLDLCAANVEGSKLGRAYAVMVDFSNTNLRGCNLEGARFENCRLRNAVFEGATLDGARFDGCDLRGARMAGASMKKTRFFASALGNADLADADLARSGFHQCSLDRASFQRANLERVLMPRCSVRGVNLEGARSFRLTRELVGEVLRQHAENDPERLRIALLAGYKADWCWDSWKEIAGDVDVLLRVWGEEVLAAYPESGMQEALEAGLPDPGTHDG